MRFETDCTLPRLLSRIYTESQADCNERAAAASDGLERLLDFQWRYGPCFIFFTMRVARLRP